MLDNITIAQRMGKDININPFLKRETGMTAT
jgi:hypothetical protein